MEQKGEIEKSRIIIGDFNTPILAMDGTTGQNISKYIEELNNIINHQDLINVYRTFHSKSLAYTLFSCAQRTYTKRVHILGYKTNLDKFKRNEIIQNVFYDIYGIKLETY